MAPRETENNAYVKFWGDKQRALWYVMVFSVVACVASVSSRGIARNLEREQFQFSRRTRTNSHSHELAFL